MHQISVIIVNWNTGSLLLKCLTALDALPEKGMIRHVVIVDNASSDTSFEQAQQAFHKNELIFLAQENNLGFAKANNVAWKYIQEHGGQEDHILLLNPDTEVQSGAIAAMVLALTQNNTAGIIGPKLLETSGDIQPSVRQFPTLGIFVLLYLKLHRLFLHSKIWKKYIMSTFDYSQAQQVDQVMGAAFLIRNTVLQKIGLLDESFWIWLEEVDYCKRAKDAGWITLYTPTATVVHHGGVSFSQKVGIAKTKPLLDSALVYAKKHLGLFAYLVLMLLYPFALGIALAASFAHKQQKEKNTSRL